MAGFVMPTPIGGTPVAMPPLEHDPAPEVPTTELEEIETYDEPVDSHDDVEEAL